MITDEFARPSGRERPETKEKKKNRSLLETID
jgi:hypothetical protein